VTVETSTVREGVDLPNAMMTASTASTTEKGEGVDELKVEARWQHRIVLAVIAATSGRVADTGN